MDASEAVTSDTQVAAMPMRKQVGRHGKHPFHFIGSLLSLDFTRACGVNYQFIQF